MATLSPLSPDGVPHFAAPDRAIERRLRDEARAEVSRLLGERELLAPGPAEEARIRVLIAERITAYQRRAATTNAPLLHDPEAVGGRLFDAILGLGILQPYMDNREIEELIVNGPSRIFIIEGGRKRLLPDVYFDSDEEVLALAKRIVGPLGRRLDEASPMVDARLPDGSRLNAAIPPVTRWPCLTVRKFSLRVHSLAELVKLQTLPESAATFLDAAVRGAINILVSGPTGSGKTTVLNALGGAIASPEERVVTVEEVGELQLQHLPDCVPLQARDANVEGVGEISIRALVRNALRMRPTRIIVGEVRSGEALDMLMAMSTGHDGSMSTIHGNSPRDALERLATLAMMAEERLGREALTRMIARSVELVVQLRFEPGTGKRRISSIFEVTGVETPSDGGTVIAGNDLWRFDPQRDRLAWTGVRPRCLEKLLARGVAYAPPPIVAAG